MRVAVFAGDGIGPEIMKQALRLLDVVRRDVTLDIVEGLLGGCAVDATGEPYPIASQKLVEHSQAVLLAAIGGPQYDNLPRPQRPERGLLALRKHLNVYANLRPAVAFPALIDASPLKPELVKNLDVMIVRELVSDVYFGEPRGIEIRDGERVGINTMVYKESEIRRVARVAFEIARSRSRRVCSVDKMNVLESSQLWREVVVEVAADFPDVTLTHMLVDNAAMQLVRNPRQFDVILTGNLFGDILSDEAAMLTGSIGLLPSASLGDGGLGLYEPIHGSAPDIQGQDRANPLGMILSVAMMLRHSLNQEKWAKRIEQAVLQVLDGGLRTADIGQPGRELVGTQAMGDAVLQQLEKINA